MKLIKSSLAFVCVLILIGCSKSTDSQPLTEPITPTPNAEERDVILSSELIKIISEKDKHHISAYKTNRIDVSRRTSPESLYKKFTFPSNFSGSIVLEWVGTSAIKQGLTEDKNLECNYQPLMQLQFVVISDDGTTKIYYDGSIAEIRQGDILKVTLDTKASDCTSFNIQFSATMLD